MGTRRSLRLPVMYFLLDEGKVEGGAARVVAVFGIMSSRFGLRTICNSDLSRGASRAVYATTGSFVTSEGAGLPFRTASMLSRASMPIAKRVSTVALPKCGKRNVFL